MNLSSYVSKGADFLRNIFTQTANKKQLAQNMRFDVVSYTTLTPEVVNQKIQQFLSQRIDTIRTDNPEFNIPSYTSNSSYTSTNTNRPESGFIDFSNSMQLLEKSIDDIVRIESQASANTMKRQLMTYPPQNPYSQYQRTFELRHGWEIGNISFNASDVFSGNVMSPSSNMSTTVSFSNAVPYTKWVQRRSTQASIHRGRWNTVEDVVEFESPNFNSRIENALNVILGD
jgi:hypothetical protein